MVKLGFLGAGFISNVHADILLKQEGVAIGAVVDAERERAAALADRTGAKVCPSLQAMLESVDAVFIAPPNALHAEAALAALAAGVHVFCEKPMATSLEDAHRVREAAAAARVAYQIGFNRRFAPTYRFLKGLVESGELTPRWAQIKMNRGELQKPSWVADPSVSGGFLYESTIHLLDMARWLFGEAQEVVCRAARGCCDDQLDEFAAIISFASGVTATLCSCAHATWLFPFERLEVFGDHAAAVAEEMERVTYCPGLDRAAVTHDQAHLPMPEKWGYVEEDVLFLKAMAGEIPPAVSAEDGYRAVELVEACYRSARTGQPVRLPL